MKNKLDRKKLISIAQNAAAVLFALLIWQAAAMALGKEILLASPISVVKRLVVLIGEESFRTALGFTCIRIVGGFFLGFVTGSILAVAAGRFKAVEILLKPLIITVKTVPVASFIVISLIWLSSKELSIFISFLMVLPIIYTNILGGLKNTSPELLEAAEVYGMNWRRRFRYIYLPALKPYLFSACSVSLGLSWKAGIAAEIIGIPDGSVGEMFYNAKVYLNTVDLFAWTLTVVAVSVLFEKTVSALLKLLYKKIVYGRGKGQTA